MGVSAGRSDYAFKPVEEKSIQIDLSRCRYLGEVHRLLKEQFGFPAYYGENWDALWDCLDGRFDGCGEILIEVTGFDEMPGELQKDCQTMLEIFKEAEEAMPNIHFEYLL